MWVLQIKFTKLAAVYFSWNMRKQQRLWHGVAITGPLTLLLLPSPVIPGPAWRKSSQPKAGARDTGGTRDLSSLEQQASSLSVPRQEPPRGVAKSHPGCWGHHQPVSTGCIDFYCTQFWAWWGGGAIPGPPPRHQTVPAASGGDTKTMGD